MKRFSIIIILLFISCLIVLSVSGQQLIRFKESNLWGYKDSSGKVVIAPQYQYAQKFYGDYAAVTKGDSTGAIDRNNKTIIPFRYEFLRYLGNDIFLFGYRAVYYGEYDMGVITADNKVIIPPTFRSITPYKGYYHVSVNIDSIIVGNMRSVRSKYGLYRGDGSVALPVDYDYISWISDSLLRVSLGNNQALFHSEGRQLTEFKYMVICDFNSGLSKIRIGDKYGYLDTNGREAIPVNYYFNYPFSDGIATVVENRKCGAIDTKEKLVIDYIYTDLGPANLGLISALKDGKWGLINTSGKVIIPLEYDEKVREYIGVIALKKNGKWQVYNRLTQKMGKPLYDEVILTEGSEDRFRDFGRITEKRYRESFLMVRAGEAWGLVDVNGKQVSEVKYSKQEVYTEANNRFYLRR